MDEIEYDDETTERINFLGLNRVYFIISNETDAASLLLINSLKAYAADFETILVGATGVQTASNYLVSSILYDSDDYTKEGENFNTAHTWAVQPIVFEVQNKNNTNQAYTPDISVDEDPLNVYPIGHQNETLISAAVQDITGSTTSAKTTDTNINSTNTINTTATSSKMVFSF